MKRPVARRWTRDDIEVSKYRVRNLQQWAWRVVGQRRSPYILTYLPISFWALNRDVLEHAKISAVERLRINRINKRRK